MGELMFRIKRFYKWDPRERRDIIISILVIAFCFAYNDKQETFNATFWILNYVRTLIIVTITFLAYDAGMKISALQQGFRAEYRMWPTGLALGVMITFITRGKFPLIIPGGLFVHHMMILRLGKFRYGLNTMAQGSIAAAGPIAMMVVMTFFLMMGKQLGIAPAFFEYAAFIAGVMLVYQLIPLPRLNGIHIFFMSRLAYIFVATTLIAYVLLSLMNVLSWILSILIGGIAWLSWWYFVEGGKGK